jgi:hypothetical protein
LAVLRIAGLVLLALTPAVARGDVGVAPRRVPVQITLAVDRDYPGFAVFLVQPEPKRARRITPTAAEPAIVQSGNLVGSHFYAEVYVVPTTELAGFDQLLPPVEWFEQKDHHEYYAGRMNAREILDIFDNRNRIEKEYVVRRAGDAFRVELLSENRGNPWVKGFRGVVCCGLPPIAIAWGGVWLVRRSNRNRRSRLLPPPH